MLWTSVAVSPVDLLHLLGSLTWSTHFHNNFVQELVQFSIEVPIPIFRQIDVESKTSFI